MTSPPSTGRIRIPWIRDEVILALDLYLRAGRKVLDEHDPRVIEVSEALRRLPFHPTRDDRFRNPNGVVLKLANLRSLDRPGSGMAGASATDRRTWDELATRQADLEVLAESIRSVARTVPVEHLATVEEDEEQVFEGRLLFRFHRVRERNSAKAADKRRRAMAEQGRLACEVCGFDFFAAYGAVGRGYIECHHRVPLSVAGEGPIRLADLALVCSNCHRMLHRSGAPWDLDGLRHLLEIGRTNTVP